MLTNSENGVEVVDVFEAVKGRRSIRAFRRDDVSLQDVKKLIDAATWAPSAGNTQPWEFVIIRKPDSKKRIAAAAWEQSFIEEAPVVIVVCANENRSSQRYGDRGRTLYCLQDTAAAIQNIHLAAYSLGLGTCWVGAFKEEEVRQIVKVPQGIRPVSIIPVGYPARSASLRSRRPMNEVVHEETY
jgi:nitroreductase